MDYYKALENRRSIYSLSKQSSISDERIVEIVEFATMHTPSAFHSQSQKVFVLFNDKHDKLWQITLETLRKIVPEAAFSSTERKIKSFQNAHGTILFFDDTAITKKLQQNNPLYSDNFPIWAEQSNGMLQLTVWTALELEGLGASLQHYNPLIDDELKETFGINKEYKLIAQMPFGGIEAMAEKKIFTDIKTRVTILK